MIDLSKKRELALHAAVVSAVSKIAPDAFFVAGAQARDLLLLHHHGVATERATLDLDIAVMVASWAEFHQLRNGLIGTADFASTSQLHRMRFGELNVDIVPFGGVETVNGTITWPSDGATMNAIGFTEALSTCVTVRLPGGVEVRVASLPAQALLKLMAWSDRNPDRGTKDLQDFRLLARTYHQAVSPERLYAHVEAVDPESFDLESAGAWLLGYDAAFHHAPLSSGANIAEVRRGLVAEVDRQLNRLKTGDRLVTFVGSMGGPIEANTRLVASFHEGLHDALSKHSP